MSLETIQPIIDWIANHPELSGLVIFLIAFGESLALVGIVVPGVVFMISIGTLVGLGAINLWSALVWAALGAIAGDWLSYWLGRHFDKQLRHLWPLSRYPKLIPAGEKFFIRHGGKSVLFGRFVGPLRPIIPAIAGIMHMSQAKFYFMNIVSAILWAPVVIMPGVAFGHSLQLAQEVFAKLIILIVIAIVIAALFGYLAKKLFAYALMTTVNTWGELFGFDRARENLTSFSLAGVMILVVAVFVAQHEQHYPPVANNQQVVDEQWWQDNWQKYGSITVYSGMLHKDFPIAVQWWGSLKDIKTKLEQLQWQQAKHLSFENSLTYFVSKPDVLKLPARKRKLFDNDDQLIMVKAADSTNQIFVFRLWSAKVRPDLLNEQLWLGVIYSVELVSPFDLVNIPFRDVDYSESLRQFEADISLDSDLTVRQRYYLKTPLYKSWKGDVLLLSFKESVENQLTGVGKAGLIVYPLTASAKDRLAVVAPTTFEGSVETGFSYQNNGVVIRMRRHSGNGIPGLTNVKNWIRQQLENPQEFQHSQLVSLSEEALPGSHMQGTQFIARYDIPFLGKQMIYRVKLMQLGDEIWIATAVHKQCDPEGERSIVALLNAVKLSSVN